MTDTLTKRLNVKNGYASQSAALQQRFNRLQDLFWQRSAHKPRILVLGAGYAGVTCVLGLQNLDAKVTLINQNDYHYLTTLLHEPAVGRRDFHEVTVDLPGLLQNTDIAFRTGSVTAIDVEAQTVTLVFSEETDTLDYDFLVVALGSKPEFYRIPGLEENALTLNNWSEAARLHLRVEEALIDFKEHPNELWRTHIVIGGAGLTGVEVAGELADWCKTLTKSYGISSKQLKISLVDGSSTVLAACQDCQDRVIPLATKILQRKGIQIHTGVHVQAIEPHRVVLSDGQVLEAGLIIWTGGVRGNPLLEAAGFALGRQKRALVNDYLQAKDHPEIFVVGDSAAATDARGNVLPPTAQAAIQQGPMVADNFQRLFSRKPMRSCVPRKMGVLLSLGEKDALGVIENKYHFSGWVARTMKNAIAYQYLASLGGLRLAWTKLLKQDKPVPAIAAKQLDTHVPWWTRLGIATAAGLLGTTAMTTMGAVAASFGLVMDPPAILGGFFNLPLWAGWAMHGGIGVMLAWFYVFFFANRLDGPAFAQGAIYGFLPFLAAQTIVMPLMGAGLFSSALGALAPMTVLGSWVGHSIYGGVTAWVYANRVK